MPKAWYNEHDPYAAEWLRNLIAEKVIPDGYVDERDIRDVYPSDLIGFTQCHFFAGIGVWPYSFRRAGWPDDRPVWSGSCPCQPFSAAGRGEGFADERHLWPHWFHLIEACSPTTIFGEQVAGADGLAWLDLVSPDLEGAGYAQWVDDLCVAGFGSPQIRQRLFFAAKRRMADSRQHGSQGRLSGRPHSQWEAERRSLGRGGATGGLAYSDGDGRYAGLSRDAGSQEGARGEDRHYHDRRRLIGSLADSEGERRGRGERSAPWREHDRTDARWEESDDGLTYVRQAGNGPSIPGAVNGAWRDVDWLRCRDGNFRPVEPGSFPLVDGAAASVGPDRAFGEPRPREDQGNRKGRLKGYGNAISPEVAIRYVQAFMSL